MKLHKLEVISLILVILSFLVGWYFYPQLPQQVASHWNSQGQVNGYMSKFWGAFLLPIILTGMFLIFLIVPRIDPKRENIEKFRTYFNSFIVLLFLFMFYIYALTLAWNMGYQFDFVRFISPAFAVLFYDISILIAHAEPNWTIGIRTPWTLSNAEVWKKTHALGAKLFRYSALIGLLGVIFPKIAIWLILLPIIASTLWVFVYSYLEYRKIKR